LGGRQVACQQLARLVDQCPLGLGYLPRPPIDQRLELVKDAPEASADRFGLFARHRSEATPLLPRAVADLA
jgi:hypothetical protein